MMLSYIFSIYHGWLGYIPEKKKQGIDNMEFHPGVAIAIEEIACRISRVSVFWPWDLQWVYSS